MPEFNNIYRPFSPKLARRTLKWTWYNILDIFLLSRLGDFMYTKVLREQFRLIFWNTYEITPRNVIFVSHKFSQLKNPKWIFIAKCWFRVHSDKGGWAVWSCFWLLSARNSFFTPWCQKIGFQLKALVISTLWNYFDSRSLAFRRLLSLSAPIVVQWISCLHWQGYCEAGPRANVAIH